MCHVSEERWSGEDIPSTHNFGTGPRDETRSPVGQKQKLSGNYTCMSALTPVKTSHLQKSVAGKQQDGFAHVTIILHSQPEIDHCTVSPTIGCTHPIISTQNAIKNEPENHETRKFYKIIPWNGKRNIIFQPPLLGSRVVQVNINVFILDTCAKMVSA